MNMYQERCMKENYHDARSRAMKHRAGDRNDTRRDDNPVYSFRMLQALRDMAENGVYPDGSFGDEECNIWEMFYLFHKKD